MHNHLYLDVVEEWLYTWTIKAKLIMHAYETAFHRIRKCFFANTNYKSENNYAKERFLVIGTLILQQGGHWTSTNSPEVCVLLTESIYNIGIYEIFRVFLGKFLTWESFVMIFFGEVEWKTISSWFWMWQMVHFMSFSRVAVNVGRLLMVIIQGQGP